MATNTFIGRIPSPARTAAGGVITTDEHHALLRQHVKRLQLIRVPTAAHSLQIVQPALTATTVLHFIAAHDGITCHEA